MSDEASLDTPINRATIDLLPIDVLDKWLKAIRERRLVVVRKLQDVREAKKRAYMSDLQTKYVKQYERTKRAIEKHEEQEVTIENHIHRLRAMELELVDYQDGDEHADEPEDAVAGDGRGEGTEGGHTVSDELNTA